MATLTEHPKIELFVTLTLNEREARALLELSGWGRQVADALRESISPSWHASHGEAFTEFLTSAGRALSPTVSKITQARGIFNGANP